MGVGVMGQTEYSLGDDVALYLAGASSDGQRGGEQKAVEPRRIIELVPPDAIGHECGRTEKITRQVHHVLAMLVCHHLADARLRPRLVAPQPRRHGPQADQMQQHVFDVDVGNPLPHHRITKRSATAHDIEQIERRRPHPPQHPTGRQ